MYITKLDIKNFKSHLKSEIEFKNITLLTGLNGAGKSSVFQSIRMLWQHLKTNDPIINEYGEISTLRNESSKEQFIKFEYSLEHKKFVDLIIETEIEEKKYINTNVLDSYNLSYISANRLGPTEFQHIRNNMTHEKNVGDFGEFTLDILSKYADEKLPDIFKEDDRNRNTLEYHIQKWLQVISPNTKLDTAIDKKLNIASFTINGFTPLNVGFGVSYTMSILVQLFYSVILLDQKEIKSIVLIENPEAHLHPSGQTKIAELISIIANYGVQVIVETHSDYILDGLRLSVKDKIIDKDKTKLYYFELVKDKINFSWNTEVQSPTIEDNGHLDKWPENFFDTSLNNKMKLM